MDGGRAQTDSLRNEAALPNNKSISAVTPGKRPVQRTVLNRLGDVLGLNRCGPFQISNSPRNFQNAIMRASGEPLLHHGAFQQALAIALQLAEDADVPRAHLRVAIEAVAPRYVVCRSSV